MKMNEIYEAPELEVLNVMIEKGFAISPDEDSDPNMGGGIEDPFAQFLKLKHNGILTNIFIYYFQV